MKSSKGIMKSKWANRGANAHWGGALDFAKNLGLRYICFGRMSENARNPICRFILDLILHHYKDAHGLSIPFGNIGAGLAMGYPYSIIVNGGVKMGNEVTLFKGTLIGSVRYGKRHGVPKIGNHVVVGCNAVVVGGITIGNDVMIAANSFVDFDVPDHSLVIGNPGVIHHKENATEGYC